jgi:putative nucleotidyltransferase with HDIG domain
MTELEKIVRDADLPTPSPILHRLFDMMFDPNSSLENIAETISTDAGLSARALRVANAAFSSPECRIESIRDAVVRIGLATLTQILSTTEIKAIFFSVPEKHGDMQYLWMHNLTTACMADAYAQQLRLEKPSRWFTGGLLHDIGRLVLLRYDSTKYVDAAIMEEVDHISISDAERIFFGTTHEEVGYELMKLWQFPEEIAEAAYHHDQPFDSLDDFHSGICIANDIAKAFDANEPLPEIEGLSIPLLVTAASKKIEMMKKVSGSF